jgi:GT2 family glycosyltransferase
MMPSPRVLVVLPTLGQRNDRLTSALESIDQQRDQVDLTIALVVPEGNPETEAIGRAFGATIVRDPGAGMAAAMNQGRTIASSEDYTIWLGDDDRYLPGALATLVSLLDHNPDRVVAYGACDYVDESGRLLWTNRAGALAAKIISWGPNLIPHPAALIRRAILDDIGGYDPDLKLVMDLDVFLRLKKRGRFIATTEPVAAFGWHETSLTVSDRLASEREARLVKRRHLPGLLRPVAPLWEWPIAWASRIQAARLNRRVGSPHSG